MRYSLAEDPELQLFDVRNPCEFRSNFVAGARSLPLTTVEANENIIDATKPLYLICKSGKLASDAAELLKERHSDIRVVAGGMQAWEAQNYPVCWKYSRKYALSAAALSIITAFGIGSLLCCLDTEISLKSFCFAVAAAATTALTYDFFIVHSRNSPPRD